VARDPVHFINLPDIKEVSYENTECPCGGKKQRETLICEACALHITEMHNDSGRFDLSHYQDNTYPQETRRRMAINVLALARRRNKRLPLSFAM
jgi:hypothetical protein